MNNNGGNLYYNIETMSRISTLNEERWKVKTLMLVG
jgi:hypothetical protein